MNYVGDYAISSQNGVILIAQINVILDHKILCVIIINNNTTI